MAKSAAKPKKEVSMEEALWKSADKLRGSVEPAEYKHVVLSLFFLKFASDKFEAQRKTIAEKYGEKFIDNVAFYTKDNVFFLPEDSRWSYIIEHAKQDDIALKIDTTQDYILIPQNLLLCLMKLTALTPMIKKTILWSSLMLSPLMKLMPVFVKSFPNVVGVVPLATHSQRFPSDS